MPEIQSETITLTAADGTEFSAYKAEPAQQQGAGAAEGDQVEGGAVGGGAVGGGIVVVQEIFGVNDHIRSVADGYAAEGYLAIAPALFDRVEPGVELGYDVDGRDKGVEIAFKGLTMDGVMADVSAAAQVAAEAGSVGIVGYCWGGSICYAAAARLADQISAASGYYGGQIMPHIDEQPAVPLMLHFGSEDAGIPLDDVKAIADHWPHVDVHIYEGADHGFNCDARASFHPEASALAKERTLSLFAEFLR